MFVDHGLVRLNEGDEVEEVFRKWNIHFVRANAEELFLCKLAGVTEAERKHKIIGEEFIRVFEAEAKKIDKVDYLVQGTIYPDVIEPLRMSLRTRCVGLAGNWACRPLS